MNIHKILDPHHLLTYFSAMDDHEVKISPPLYMIGLKLPCWRCDARMSVIALLASNVEDAPGETCILSDVVDIPNNILSFIQKRVPTYKLRYSKTVKQTYFANTCPKCGVIYGEWFLSDEPGAPFFPTDDEEAKSLYIKEIPLKSKIKISAGLRLGAADIILSNAKRV